MRFPLWQTKLWFEVIKLYSLAKDDKSFPSFVKIYLSKMSKLIFPELMAKKLWCYELVYLLNFSFYHLYEFDRENFKIQLELLWR